MNTLINNVLTNKKAQINLSLLIVLKLIVGSVDLSRLNLQQSVWYLGKAEPM